MASSIMSIMRNNKIKNPMWMQLNTEQIKVAQIGREVVVGLLKIIVEQDNRR